MQSQWSGNQTKRSITREIVSASRRAGRGAGVRLAGRQGARTIARVVHRKNEPLMKFNVEMS